MSLIEKFFSANSQWIIKKIYIFKQPHRGFTRLPTYDENPTCHVFQLLEIWNENTNEHAYLRIDRDDSTKLEIMDDHYFSKLGKFESIVFIPVDGISIADYFFMGEEYGAEKSKYIRPSCQEFALNCLKAQERARNILPLTTMQVDFICPKGKKVSNTLMEIRKQTNKNRSKKLNSSTTKQKCRKTIGSALTAAGYWGRAE